MALTLKNYIKLALFRMQMGSNFKNKTQVDWDKMFNSELPAFGIMNHA